MTVAQWIIVGAVAWVVIVAVVLTFMWAANRPAPKPPQRTDALSASPVATSSTQASGGLDCARRTRLGQVERRPGTVDPGAP